MYKKHPFHLFLMFSIVLTILFSGVTSSTALSSIAGKRQNQVSYDELNLMILVKASRLSNDPINDFETNPKTKLQVVQDSIKAVRDVYQFPQNMNIGVMAYGHLLVRDYDMSCKENNVEELLPLQSFSKDTNLDSFKGISGMGDAPTSVALKEAANKLPKDSPNKLNAILLIADGSDSCGQSPESQAKLLFEEQGVVIYTIGLLVNDITLTELTAIAENSSGKNSYVPTYLGTNQDVTDELTKLIISILDELASQISEPEVIPTLIASTPEVEISPDVVETEVIPTMEFSVATDVPIPTNVPVIVESPSETRALFVIMIGVIIGLILLSIFGYVYWNSRLRGTTTKASEQIVERKPQITSEQKEDVNAPRAKRVDLTSVNLDEFLQDVYRTYSSFGNGGRYIPLETLKQKISSLYLEDQFDQLLILARQKYPNNVWVDKDSKGKTIVKIVV